MTREFSPKQRECAGLIMMLIEGHLSEAKRVRLNEYLRQDSGCRQLYTSVMSVHSMLLWSNELSVQHEEEIDDDNAFLIEVYEQARLNRIKLDAEAELAKNLRAQAEEEEKRRKKLEASVAKARSRIIIIPRLAAYGGAAAAVLLALVLLWPVLRGSGLSDEPNIAAAASAAQLVRSENAVWDQSLPSDGVFVAGQQWTLRQGFAEIVMASGASAILHGPAAFRVLEQNKLALDEGRLTAEVPDRAKYFTVHTRSMDIVDLGTRFGVTVGPDGASSTSVFEGKVEVQELARNDSRPARRVALTAGQQLRADASGQLADAITTIEPDHGYITRWGAIGRLVGVQGQARFFNTPPNSVAAISLENTDQLVVFAESVTVLERPLEVWSILPPGREPKTTVIPAGRRVVSYFVHYPPGLADDTGGVTATLQFPGRVLGVVGTVKQMRATNALLGLESVEYMPESVSTAYSLDPNTPDMFAVGGLQSDLLTIHLAAGEFADQARVIVELPRTAED